MPRLDYFLVAESMAIDQITNRVSIFNVLEEFGAPHFPVVVPQLAAIASWILEPGELGKDFNIAVRISAPGKAAPVENRATFRATRPRHRYFSVFFGIEVPQPGAITIDLEINGVHQATHAITAVLGRPPSAPVDPAKQN